MEAVCSGALGGNGLDPRDVVCAATVEEAPLILDGGDAAGGAEGGATTVAANATAGRRKFAALAAAACLSAALLFVGFADFDGGLWRSSRGPLSAGPAALTSAEELFSDADGLLPWHLAKKKAAHVEAKMTAKERHKLVAGQGFMNIGSWVGTVAAIPRLDIPALRLQDASSGFRPTGPHEYGTVTSWPSMLTLASSWDEKMVYRVAAAIAREFKGKGANVLLGPGINVHRTPYGGRNWEYLSGEDPYLGARLAPHYVKAVQSQGVMAVIKHFAFNEQETERNSENSIVSERAKWELYYPPFQAAIDAGAGAVMCSYNRVNGHYACDSHMLLEHDLKGRMGFQGFVMSDWGAVPRTSAIDHGLDQEQPSASHFTPKNLHRYAEPASVRDAVRRVLAATYHLRIDKHPGCRLPCKHARSTNQRTSEHLKLAEDAAAAGIVLLQNNGVLPLDPDRVKTIAVLGAARNDKDTMNTWGQGSPYSGGGSGHIPAPNVVTPLEGIRARAEKAGIRVITVGTDHLPRTRRPTATEAASRRLLSTAHAVEAADVVIVVGSSTATESVDRHNLFLDDGAGKLIAEMSKKKPTIALLEVPGAVLTSWRDKTAAIACLFHGGERTGHAWASVLFGDVAPSGKLPIAFPASLDRAIRPGHGAVRYHEGLFTSYRSQRLDAAFPFGHGLSYTKFKYEGPRLVGSECPTEVCVEVLIENVGDKRGSEVAQAYLGFEGVPGYPKKVLKGFRKTSMLNPGAVEKVAFHFTERDLSTYNEDYHNWVRHPNSKITVHIGASSADIRQVLPLTSGTSASSHLRFE